MFESTHHIQEFRVSTGWGFLSLALFIFQFSYTHKKHTNDKGQQFRSAGSAHAQGDGRAGRNPQYWPHY